MRKSKRAATWRVMIRRGVGGRWGRCEIAEHDSCQEAVECALFYFRRGYEIQIIEIRALVAPRGAGGKRERR